MRLEDYNKLLLDPSSLKEASGPVSLELEYSDETLYENPISFEIFSDVYRWRIHFDIPASYPEFCYSWINCYSNALELLNDFEEQEITIKEILREVIKTMISDRLGNLYLREKNEIDFITSIYSFYFENKIVSKKEQQMIFDDISNLINNIFPQIDACNYIIDAMKKVKINPKAKFFKTTLTNEQLIEVKNILEKRGYLKKTINRNFLHYFERSPIPEEPLKWMKGKQSLANIIHMICDKKSNRRPAIKYAFNNDKFNTNHKIEQGIYTDNDTNEIEKEIKNIISTKSSESPISDK